MFQLKKVIAAFILAALNFAETRLLSVVPKTGWDEIILSLKIVFNDVRAIVTALSDDNPLNKEQVKAILQDSAQKDAPVILKALFQRAETQVKAPELKSFIRLLSSPSINTVLLMTDDNPENEAQLKAMLNSFYNDPQTKTEFVEGILVPFLTAQIKDEALRNFILDLIRNGLIPQEN